MTISSVARMSRKTAAALLMLPMVLFLGLVFFVPLAGMLGLAVSDTELATVMPLTVRQISSWDGRSMPPASLYEAATRDLAAARDARTVGTAARRLNFDESGLRGVILTTARGLPKDLSGISDWKQTLVGLDPAWGQVAIWASIARSSGPWTDYYLLAALDLRRGPDGLERVPPENALYVSVLGRTFVIAFSATVIALLLAVPTAHLLASTSATVSSLLMLVLLLPLWTSVLVRSAAWLVILQKTGLVNQALQAVHAISEPLALIYNRTGVLIALTHILLPFAVLPIVGAMKNLPATQMRAASSLGAPPLTAFWRIYLPQILPGISAGGLLVFILALGYYITPLLLGGTGDQLLPFYIAFNTQQTVNWGLAAALGSILLVATLVLYWVYARLVGVDRIGL